MLRFARAPRGGRGVACAITWRGAPSCWPRAPAGRHARRSRTPAASEAPPAAGAAPAAVPDAADLPPLRSGPSVWLGPDMAARRSEWELQLSGAEVEEVEGAVAALLQQHGLALTASGDCINARSSSSSTSNPAAPAASAEAEQSLAQSLATLAPADFPLPSLGPRLQALRAELLHGRGFALLRRLPLERLGRVGSAAAFMGVGCWLGRARSQNAAGHVLGHVCDTGLRSSDPSVRIYQTRERQTFHTDSCDVVGLLCLCEARTGGDSLLVSADSLYNTLARRSPHLAARLLAPMPHDRRGEVPAGQEPWFDIPVFSWHDPHLTVFYQRQYFDSAQRFPQARRLAPSDVAALDALDAAANDPALHLAMRLAPGDVQFVHNHNMLHDRTAFEDWPEPWRRRHLLRLWLAVPGARPLPPAFAARYGSLTVGDRGGICVPGTTLTVPLTSPARAAAAAAPART